MRTPTNRPIPDSYWVIPGHLLAGEYPGAPRDFRARQKLRRLFDAGIDFFLDLTEEGEGQLRPYAQLAEEEAVAFDTKVFHKRLPIPDLATPTQEQMVIILNVIDQAIDEGRKVYVHCWGGIGRTGTVVGCYLVRHGMNGREALRQIAEWRKGTPDGWRQSPETAAQCTMVENWSEGSQE